jgi:hypothetical protein
MGEKRFNIDVIRMEPVGKGKVKVKIAQTQVNLSTMHHEGKDYTVISNIGRGRYIMRPMDLKL